MPDNNTDYKKYVSEKLAALTPVFAKASVGDFSKDIEIPSQDDEFTQLYVGIQIMLEVIREQLEDERLVGQTLQAIKDKVESEKALYEAILESMGDGAIVTDTHGKINLINYHAQIMLGFRPSEVVSRDYFEAIAAVDDVGHPIALHKRALSIALKEGRKSSSSYNFVKKDKSILPVAITASPIILGGQTVGCIVVFRDITREKQIDKMKSEFLSFAAHQLRTPLGIMRWNMELLIKDKKDNLSPKTLDRLSALYKSNQKMISLVNDLLNVSRIEGGKIVHVIEDVNLKDIINEVVKEIAGLAEEKMVKLEFHLEELPSVKVDKSKLKDILLNIVGNALKFNVPLGKIQLKVHSQKDVVLIIVSDSGIGIPPRDAPRIFEKFYRASNAVLGQTPGSGLGLFVVKSYIENWGGRIWFESPAQKEFLESVANKDNPGTSFYIELPIKNKEVKK